MRLLITSSRMPFALDRMPFALDARRDDAAYLAELTGEPQG
jgi:hypothetical protein